MNQRDEPIRPEGLLLRLARALGVNRAVLYALFLRAWQFLAGPVTIVVIARRFSPDEQGFYYAFASLLAMNSFFELGLFNVVVNVAAHEWAGIDRQAGDVPTRGERSRERLRSFARFVARWYGAVALAFFVALSIGGTVFLSRAEGIHSGWLHPWLAATVVASAQLFCQPFNSILEGCNLVASVNRMQFLANALAAVTLWIVIAAGGGLWALPASSASRLAANLHFLLVRHGELLGGLLSPARPGESAMDWRTEVWPLQWRIGIQGAFSWFHYSMFVPVLFYFEGPASAGRFGMTWQIATVIQVTAFAWIQSRAPELAIHAARGEYGKLDRLFQRAFVVALGVVTIGSVAFEIVLALVGRAFPEIASRLLDARTTALLLAGRVLFVVVLGTAAYVRAHRIEPFAPMMLSVSAAVGVLAWVSGMHFGAEGQAWSTLAIYSLVALPWAVFIYRRTRREEQSPRPGSFNSSDHEAV